MEHAYDNSIAGAKLGSSANPGKPLESIALAAQRVNNGTVAISRFLDRFHGSSPPEDAGAKAVSPDAIPPYANSIEHLFHAIDRLETRIEALNALG